MPPMFCHNASMGGYTGYAPLPASPPRGYISDPLSVRVFSTTLVSITKRPVSMLHATYRHCGNIPRFKCGLPLCKAAGFCHFCPLFFIALTHANT